MNTPRIHTIVAIDRNGAIGYAGDLIYRFRQDLRRFKAITLGNTVVMGRRTWESLPGALPGRRNIVVTTQADYRADGAETASSLQQALEMAAAGPGETYIIGGAALYASAAAYADVLELTVVHDRAPLADTWFPPLPLEQYRVSSVVPADTEPPLDFITLEKR